MSFTATPLSHSSDVAGKSGRPRTSLPLSRMFTLTPPIPDGSKGVSEIIRRLCNDQHDKVIEVMPAGAFSFHVRATHADEWPNIERIIAHTIGTAFAVSFDGSGEVKILISRPPKPE